MRRSARLVWLAALAVGGVSATTAIAHAAASLTQISSDPFTNSTSQHATEVEPDTFSFGSTIVVAEQVGRFFDGGSSDIGWETSGDGGSTWTHGFLPGITEWQGGGSFERVSDASVAYDAKHGVWMISSIPVTSSVTVPEVVVSRSTNGGTTWGNPVVVSSFGDLDKNWTTCDDTSTSPDYGHCYTEFDEDSANDAVYMSTSTDGGLTWSAAVRPSGSPGGLGGQPLVQPNGTVVVPYESNSGQIRSFRSTNGGAGWTSSTTIATADTFTDPGGIRSGPLPSAAIDGAGKVYVSWEDCRFRSGCASNDIVYSSSSNGTTWSSVTRVPIDATSSTVDHLLPGLAVDKSTSGSSAHIGLSYYYFPNAGCSTSNCQLDVGYISSANAGSSWTTATQLAGPMSMSWLPGTDQGSMVGDYMATSFVNGVAFPAIEVAAAVSGSTFNQATFVPATGLRHAAATHGTTTADRIPVPGFTYHRSFPTTAR